MVAERVWCDLCGREMQHWFDICGDYRRPQEGEQFHLYWCRTDKFGKVFPRPTADEVKGFYDLESYYTHHKPDSHKKGAVEQDSAHARWGFFPRLRQHLAWRLDYGGDLGVACLKEFVRSGARSLLAVGCGSGSRLNDAMAAGFEVIKGIEPDPIAREIATSRGFEVYPGTAEEPAAEIRERSYDVILLMHVLEHTLDPQGAIASAKKMLSPNGSLIVETPNNLAIGQQLAGRSWPWLDVPRHLNFFCSASLQKILQMSGLKITKIDYCGYNRQFSKKWLETELEILEFVAGNGRSPSRLRSMYNELRAWTLLCLTSVSRPRRKYDSVRIVAQNCSDS